MSVRMDILDVSAALKAVADASRVGLPEYCIRNSVIEKDEDPVLYASLRGVGGEVHAAAGDGPRDVVTSFVRGAMCAGMPAHIASGIRRRLISAAESRTPRQPEATATGCRLEPRGPGGSTPSPRNCRRAA